MSLVLVLIGQFCCDAIGRQIMKVVVIGWLLLLLFFLWTVFLKTFHCYCIISLTGLCSLFSSFFLFTLQILLTPNLTSPLPSFISFPLLPLILPFNCSITQNRSMLLSNHWPGLWWSSCSVAGTLTCRYIQSGEKSSEIEFALPPSKTNSHHKGVQVAEWSACRSLTNAARVRFPAGYLIPAL